MDHPLLSLTPRSLHPSTTLLPPSLPLRDFKGPENAGRRNGSESLAEGRQGRRPKVVRHGTASDSYQLGSHSGAVQEAGGELFSQKPQLSSRGSEGKTVGQHLAILKDALGEYSLLASPSVANIYIELYCLQSTSHILVLASITEARESLSEREKEPRHEGLAG